MREIKQAIQNQINWLEASKEDFTGETYTNALFQIEYLKKVLQTNTPSV